MSLCPITYEKISEGYYSRRGLKKLNPALVDLKFFPFDRQEIIREAQKRMTKMSIAGVQPKLSAQLSVKNSQFILVDRHGSYILKPGLSDYEDVPQNEDLTMRLASLSGIDIPLHGLIYAKDQSMIFFIRRFDRTGTAGKIHVEDFAQIAGKSRETKYDYSMEKLMTLIEQYCTFPMVEKTKLFRRVLFSWLVGNEDMHLKNFSIIHRDPVIELSPAYDLLNTTIVLANPTEEMALPLMGKKSNFNSEVFFEYFAKQRLGLNEKVIHRVADEMKDVFSEWVRLIEISFLNDENKEKYLDIVNQRREIIGWA